MIFPSLYSQPTTTKEALRKAVMTLQRAHIESASLDARVLMEHALHVSRERLLLLMDEPLTVQQEIRFREMIAKRARRRPVAQIIGQREFFGLNFRVTEATLDPRPDSETLIEALLKRFGKHNAPKQILDLGTGTGCLLLTLLQQFPEAQGVGVDISPAALAVAQENALSLGMRTRARFIQSDWLDGIEGTFDIVISNPPYIPSAVIPELAPEVARFEPKLALDGGMDGLDPYRIIIPALPGLLNAGGVAALEIGIGQQHGIETIAKEAGVIVEQILPDMQGIPRCVLLHSLTTKDQLNA